MQHPDQFGLLQAAGYQDADFVQPGMVEATRLLEEEEEDPNYRRRRRLLRYHSPTGKWRGCDGESELGIYSREWLSLTSSDGTFGHAEDEVEAEVSRLLRMFGGKRMGRCIPVNDISCIDLENAADDILCDNRSVHEYGGHKFYMEKYTTDPMFLLPAMPGKQYKYLLSPMTVKSANFYGRWMENELKEGRTQDVGGKPIRTNDKGKVLVRHYVLVFKHRNGCWSVPKNVRKDYELILTPLDQTRIDKRERETSFLCLIDDTVETD